MQIFVNNRVLDVAEATSVEELKLSIAAAEGVDASEIYLTCAGHVLSSGSLAENGVCSLSTVDVQARLLGGKVHGSLARAGKVRGQTPKVEKAEKKKKKTGRAKRRMQYNKRFVNVVPGIGGKRKGPNSNADKVGI
eukprot:m.10028 g.10028  ORF g.10028 m.10028 type:complete len:136 (-) comp5111_c0_seq1:217-624(-)